MCMTTVKLYASSFGNNTVTYITHCHSVTKTLYLGVWSIILWFSWTT